MIKIILKKIALTILPIMTIIAFVHYIMELISYVPDGTHANLGHIYDGLFFLLSVFIVFLYIVGILFIWFSERFRWYIYLLNIIVFINLVVMGITKINDYISHKKHEELKRIEKLSLKKIDHAWNIIDNEKKVIEIIDDIVIEEDGYIDEVDKKVSALYMALSLKNPEKKEFYKSKAKEVNSYTCSMTEELLSHINIEDETMLLDIFTEIISQKERKTYNVFNNCMPYRKSTFIKKLLKEKKIKMISYFLKNQYLDSGDIVNILLEFKNIEDDKLRKKMMTTLLENYKYWILTSFTRNIRNDISIFEQLQDFKEFPYYTGIMTKRLVVAKEESSSAYANNSNSLLVGEDLKEDFIKLTTILDDNSSFMQEIPQYIRTHFYEEALKDKKPEQYALFQKIIDTNLHGDDTYRYNLYVDDKMVDSSLLDYRGYIRYRFNIKDKGKKVVIKYGEVTVTDVLEEKELPRNRTKYYWIIDKDKE